MSSYKTLMEGIRPLLELIKFFLRIQCASQRIEIFDLLILKYIT